jgi:hypothetical protein
MKDEAAGESSWDMETSILRLVKRYLRTLVVICSKESRFRKEVVGGFWLWRPVGAAQVIGREGVAAGKYFLAGWGEWTSEVHFERES